ncbi:MAG: right-handed parallel beta-helix repeat-containing protein, partial [Phycisphaeraceae bacterium]
MFHSGQTRGLSTRTFLEALEPRILLDGDPVTPETLYYVNDASTIGDIHATAIGLSTNDGLTPSTPLDSVQSLLDLYDLGPGDLVLIDSGTYSEQVLIDKDDEGASFQGVSGLTTWDRGGTHWDLVDADGVSISQITFTGSGTAIQIRSGTVDPSSSSNITDNLFSGVYYGVSISGGVDHCVNNNTFDPTVTYGLYTTNTTNLQVDQNIVHSSYGISLNSTQASVTGNAFTNSQNSIQASSNGTLSVLIAGNTILGVPDPGNSSLRGTGISITNIPATITDNNISQKEVGIDSNTAAAQVLGNRITNNTLGFEGYGVIGGTHWDPATSNLFEFNSVGVRANSNSIVRFNEFFDNVVGLEAKSNASDAGILFHHNILADNTSAAIRVDATTGVEVLHNTIDAAVGDGLRVENSSADIAFHNNIVWARGGYAVHVSTTSQTGFSSNYNNLFTSAAGQVGWWQKPFGDLFDWQAEVDLDLNSIGYTAIDPTRDDPHFVDAGARDFHLQDTLSTSIDAGDPADLFSLEPGINGNRVNLGAYGNTSGAATSAPASIAIDSPEYYRDVLDAASQTP